MKESNSELAKVLEPVTVPDYGFLTGATLRELYEAKKHRLKLSDRQIQSILGIDRKTLNPILDGQAKQVNVVNIIKLAHFLGLSVSDALRVYLPKAPEEQISDIDNARMGGYIVEYFDVATLTKLGFFLQNASARQISQKITRFFRLKSLYEYSSLLGLATAFSRTKRSSDALMRDFWVKSAYVQFKGIANPNPYNRAELLDLIAKIRPYTRNEKDGLAIVIKALFSVGVTIIFQRSLDKAQVRGATMIVDNKPCVVLSDFNKQYPTLWFTLLHELYHVLFDFEDLQKQTYHVSNGNGDLFLTNEERADNFATEYLLPSDRLQYAQGFMRSPYYIEKLAKQWSIHPSIIYSRHCYATGEWSFYSKFIPKMDIALELINTNTFGQKDLMDSVEQIKQLLYT